MVVVMAQAALAVNAPESSSAFAVIGSVTEVIRV